MTPDPALLCSWRKPHVSRKVNVDYRESFVQHDRRYLLGEPGLQTNTDIQCHIINITRNRVIVSI
jgi:hypothetical protein